MTFEVRIIEFLQGLSSPFLDALMKGITLLGDEMFFIAVVAFFYWCVNKKFAFKMANIYFLSVASVEGLKNSIKRPRPFDADYTVRSIGEKTRGYSFPSGHSHSIANLALQVNTEYFNSKKRSVLIITSVIAVLLVMLSRMYLGQHYLSDVLAGVLLTVMTVTILSFLYNFLGEKEERIMLIILPVCCILIIVLLCLGDLSRFSDMFKVLGAYPAFVLGYYLEKKYIQYNVKSDRLYKQLIKIVSGLLLILLLKEGLKYLFPPHIIMLSSFLRYLILGISAALLAPLMFKKLKL